MRRDLKGITGEKPSRTGGDKASRNVGEAPSIGRVTRSPQSGTVNKDGAISASARRRQRQKMVKAWSLVLALVSVGTVIYFVISSIARTPSEKGRKIALTRQEPDLDQIFAADSAPDRESPGDVASVEIVAAALSNSDPAMVTDYFKLPPETSPVRALEILASFEKLDGPVTSIKWMGTGFANRTLVERVVVETTKDGKRRNRLAQLVPQQDGEWLIDFDAYARTASDSWENILSGKSPFSTVRVFVTPDTYYNGIFKNEELWQSYALVSPDNDEILYAYAKRETPQFRALSKILSADDHIYRATLEITNLPGTGRRQFQVSRVLAENWVTGERPFDESF